MREKEKNYLVVYMTECDGEARVARMTAAKIRERFGSYIEEIAIIDGVVLKDFEVARYPRELEI